ncbi:MAG: lipid II-degrading bacteriocin [Pseudomonas farsensis]|uniref:lipid II-degrading bacteriocin n=1 Tax=Pseudomonas farsensis TaxID=2745492 RepID=UPI003C7BBC7D
MAVELDVTYVTPYPDTGVSSFWGPSTLSMTPVFDVNNISPMADYLRIYSRRYSNPATWLETFKSEIIKNKFQTDGRSQLKALATVDQLHAEGQSMASAFSKISASMRPFQDVQDSMIKYPDEPRVFSGNVLTAIHALAHSMYGNGKPVTFPIGNVGLKVNLNEVSKFTDSLASYGEGTHHVDVNFAYDVRKDNFSSGWTLGNITLRAVGVVMVDDGGNWSFQGVIRAFDDLYDADPSTHRDWLGEKATGFLSEVMSTPYVITIPGEIPIQASGKK